MVLYITKAVGMRVQQVPIVPATQALSAKFIVISPDLALRLYGAPLISLNVNNHVPLCYKCILSLLQLELENCTAIVGRLLVRYMYNCV
jgi:hypothetical protein